MLASMTNNEMTSGPNLASGENLVSNELRNSTGAEKLESITGGSEVMGSASKQSIKGGDSAFQRLLDTSKRMLKDRSSGKKNISNWI